MVNMQLCFIPLCLLIAGIKAQSKTVFINQILKSQRSQLVYITDFQLQEQRDFLTEMMEDNQESAIVMEPTGIDAISVDSDCSKPPDMYQMNNKQSSSLLVSIWITTELLPEILEGLVSTVGPMSKTSRPGHIQQR